MNHTQNLIKNHVKFWQEFNFSHFIFKIKVLVEKYF
jgi:hypothetical protein